METNLPFPAVGRGSAHGMRSTPPSHDPALQSPNPAKTDLDACRSHEVRSLPGSHQFASDFIETMINTIAGDPNDPPATWGITADLSDSVPAADRALYISKSTDGGETWTQMARVDSRYFDADIAEGLRNGLAVSPGGTDFVITTQEGAFQILPQSGTSDAVVKPIPGPRVPHPAPHAQPSEERGRSGKSKCRRDDRRRKTYDRRFRIL